MSDVSLLMIYDVAFDMVIAGGRTRAEAHLAGLRAIAELAVANP